MLTNKIAAIIFLAAAVVTCSMSTYAQQVKIGPVSYQVTSFDVPGAVSSSSSPEAPRISNLGLIVGFYTDSSGHTLGFYKPLGRAVVYGLKDPNDAGGFTRTAGVNDEGIIVGGYFGSDELFHGFTLQDGTYRTVDVQGATQGALINAINDLGDYVGQATNPNNTSQSEAFLVCDGHVMFITYLGESTFGQDVNNFGEMVGVSVDSSGNAHSFFVSKEGSIQPIVFPGAVSTLVVSINDESFVVGSYKDQKGNTHGFLANVYCQSYFSFDVPYAATTFPGGLNDLGVVTGHYVTADGSSHCFILEPDLF